MIGTTVGKYRIVERLGRGGMGTVYKAVDESLDREVAIKVLNPDLTDQAVLKRFRAEAVTLARLNHPGIATIYELHQQQDDLLMVMEFVRGETFHDLSDRLGPLAPPQAAHLCMQVLDALAHAHRGGVVHRDLKPANLMITDTGAVKVMDFGIARVLGSEHFTHGGYMMGTPAYMAPEQVLGREIDGRADLYSVGVVLYRLLAGRLPFSADTAISMVQMQISEAPTPIVSFRPDLPAWCTAIIDRSLAKPPSDRFQSAEEFRAALSATVTPQALGEMPTLATPAPPGMPIEPDATLPHRTPTSVRKSAASSPPPVPAAVAVADVAVTTPPPIDSKSTERTTTTVVLGRTHLAALAALFVIVAVGVAVLAVVALRGPSQPQTSAALPSTPSTSTPSASLPPPPASPAVQPATNTSSVPSPKPASPASPPPAQTQQAAPVDRSVATAGALTASAKGGARGSTVSQQAGGRASNAVDTAANTGAMTAPNAAVNPGIAAPPVTFNQVRVLISDSGKAREREGVLHLGGGQIAVLAAGGATITSIPTSALHGLFYARSKQPKWRDASGQEVESRIDLGRMGFLRSERNWIILLTQKDPIILRIEDSALRTVLPALQERTGLKIQR
jgi:eukaryotic-like serine/threonine-protein kinase